MTRQITICIAMILISGSVLSQELPQYAIRTPVILDRPFPGVEYELSGYAGNRYWVVHSDRANNLTYTVPGGYQRKTQVGYMEKFFVAERSGDYLHIYKDPLYEYEDQNDEFKEKLKISSGAMSYGWIHMDRLLLWTRSLTNWDNRIDKKAMLLNTFEGLSPTAVEDSLVKFMLNPELSINTGKKSRLFEIFYVYKITDKAVLLGQDAEIVGNVTDRKAIIRGWVPIEKTNFWDHRITLEPNWENRAFMDRTRMNVEPAVFSDARAAIDFQKGKPVDQKYKIWNHEPGADRNVGNWRRFPILSFDHNNVYKVGTMGKIDRMSSERFAWIQHLIQKLETKRRKINVLFVVDGTESMIPYYNSISAAISNSVQTLKFADTQNRFRFGAVVYRDMAEGEHLTDQIALTSNHLQVIDFVKKARTDYSQDEDTPEALYYGLRKALLSGGFGKGESNFIILVGDAGNHHRSDDSQVAEEEILKLTSNLECNLIAFQAHSKNHMSYDEFIHQSQILVLETANRVHNINFQQKEVWRIVDYEKPFFNSVGPNKYDLNNQEIMGSFLFPDKIQPLSPDLLQKEIEEKISEFDLRISRIIQEARDLINKWNSDEVSTYSEAVLGFLSKIQGLSADEIAVLKERNVQFSMDGYTSLETTKLTYPLFKHVLFLSVNELIDVTSILNDFIINPNSSINRRRQSMQNLWLSLLKAQLGQLNERQMLALPMHEISQMVLGLPIQSEFIKNIRLKDITDPAVLNDTEFEKYIDYLKFKVTRLQGILSDGYDYSFKSNGIKYFWIPVEDFP